MKHQFLTLVVNSYKIYEYVCEKKKLYHHTLYILIKKDNERGVIFSTIPNHKPFYVLFRFLLIDHHNKITKNEKNNF